MQSLSAHSSFKPASALALTSIAEHNIAPLREKIYALVDGLYPDKEQTWSAKEMGQLTWACCELISCGNLEKGELFPMLALILKDVSELNIKSDLSEKLEVNTFSYFCEFLSAHFDGHSICIQNLKGEDYSQTQYRESYLLDNEEESPSYLYRIAFSKLFSHKNLMSIRIKNSPYINEHMEWIANEINANSSLTQLCLTNCNLTENAFQLLAQFLGKSSLEVLDLSENPTTCESICDLINSGKKLSVLRLNDDGCHMNHLPENLEEVLKALEQNVCLIAFEFQWRYGKHVYDNTRHDQAQVYLKRNLEPRYNLIYHKTRLLNYATFPLLPDITNQIFLLSALLDQKQLRISNQEPSHTSDLSHSLSDVDENIW